MSEEVFGRMFVPRDLEEAALATVRLWLPTYLAEIERQRGLDVQSIPTIGSYSTSNEFYKWNEDAIPALIAVSPGRVPRRAERRANGQIDAWYRIGLAVIVGGADREDVRRISGLYGAAVRGGILQHQTLGDFGAETIEWTDERFTDIPNEQQRTLGSVQEFFEVLVPNVANWRLGRLVPEPDPYADVTDPDVVSAEVEVQLEEAT